MNRLDFSSSTIGAAVANHGGRGNFFRMVFFVLLLLGVLSGCKKDEENTSSNGYSFTPPSSWTVGTAAGGIETFTGPADGAFSPNMNIVTENFNGALKEYVDANISSLNTVFNGELVSRVAFQSNSGLSGEKLIYLTSVSGINLRYIFYFFSPKSGRKTYVVITGTGLASYDTKYDTMFDTAAKSFAWK